MDDRPHIFNKPNLDHKIMYFTIAIAIGVIYIGLYYFTRKNAEFFLMLYLVLLLVRCWVLESLSPVKRSPMTKIMDIIVASIKSAVVFAVLWVCCGYVMTPFLSLFFYKNMFVNNGDRYLSIVIMLCALPLTKNMLFKQMGYIDPYKS